MNSKQTSYNVLRMLFVLCLCLAPALLSGCGKKDDAQAPGYYSGPMQGKGSAAPPAGGTQPPAKGKAGD